MNNNFSKISKNTGSNKKLDLIITDFLKLFLIEKKLLSRNKNLIKSFDKLKYFSLVSDQELRKQHFLDFISLKFGVSSYNKLTEKQISHIPVLFLQNLGIYRSKKLCGDGNVFLVFCNYFSNLSNRLLYFIKNLLCLNNHEAATFCSDLNFYLKNIISKKFPVQEWINYVDVQTLFGYPKRYFRYFKEGEDVTLKNWLLEEKNIVLERKEILNVFTDILGSVSPPDQTEELKFSTWITMRQNWINDGAAKYSRLTVNGKKIRTKKGVGLSLTDDDLLKLVEPEIYTNDGLKVFVKDDEKGLKGRFVVNASFGFYLKQKFLIDHIIKNCLGKDKRLAMFGKSDQRIAETMYSLSKFTHIPLDFSSFDQTVVFTWFEAFDDWCDLHLTGDFKQIATELKENRTKMKVFNSEGDFIGFWKNGLPSGLYATAFFGSLINLASQVLVSKWSGGLYEPFAAQGDDGDIIYKGSNNPSMAYLSSLYEKMGLVVNPQKNWITPGLTEFLKCVVTPYNVYQYPIRVFSSLAWNYPGSYESTVGSEKLINLATLWKDFFDRLGRNDENLMIDDIFEGTFSKLKWSKKTISEWLHTHPILGGFGLWPLRFNFRFKWKSEQVKYDMKGLLFKRFVYRMVDTIKPKKIEIKTAVLKLNSEQHSLIPLSTLTHNQPATWEQYIEYQRYVAGLPNFFSVKNTAAKQSSDIPVRIFGYSDTFIKYKLGVFKFSGLTSNVMRYFSALVKFIDFGLMWQSAPQCWK